jgi:hypothetical protein
MAFRGNFANTNAVDTAGSHPSRLNWGTGVDPAHGNSAWGNDQGFPALKNPPLPEGPIHIEDNFDPETAESPQIPYQDREPSGHDGIGTPQRNRGNLYDGIASDYARHQDDRGATLKGSAHIVMRSIDQTFGTPRTQSLPASTSDGDSGISGQALRALRGRNSLAENNPGNPEVNFSGDYLRQGWEISRITDRVMRRRTLRHTKRAIHLNLASIAMETKPQTGANYSPYSSPFNGAVGRMMSGISQPMQRREPRPWDEDVTTDGSEQYSEDTSQMNAWGL